MALTVTPSMNQKTWDATVRVTGGHPLHLWGIGEVLQAAEGRADLSVDRVLVRDDADRMIGYAQLQVRDDPQDSGPAPRATVVECLAVHANRASAVPALMDALADYARGAYRTRQLTLTLDATSSPAVVRAATERGWRRAESVAAGQEGPQRLRVSLGTAQQDLSERLSAATLERCRQGLRVSGVTVREITAGSGGVAASGLKTGQIESLLACLGQDSLLLVASRTHATGRPQAIGYLWFVHTVGQAMVYRVGFTPEARELGIDDALLLTGAVELRKRGVQRLDGGDPADADLPTVLRELSDSQRTVLGTWTRELIERAEAGAPSEEEPPRRRRGLFGRRRPESEQTPAVQPAEAPRHPDRLRDHLREDLGMDGSAAAEPGARDFPGPEGAQDAPSAEPASDRAASGTTAGATAAGAAAAESAPGPQEQSGGRSGRRARRKAARAERRDREQQAAEPNRSAEQDAQEQERPTADPSTDEPREGHGLASDQGTQVLPAVSVSERGMLDAPGGGDPDRESSPETVRPREQAPEAAYSAPSGPRPGRGADAPHPSVPEQDVDRRRAHAVPQSGGSLPEPAETRWTPSAAEREAEREERARERRSQEVAQKAERLEQERRRKERSQGPGPLRRVLGEARDALKDSLGR